LTYDERENIVTHDTMIDAERLLLATKQWGVPIAITRKLDGWAGILWRYGEHWGIASRGSFDSPGAVYATERFQKFVKYGAAQDFIPKNTTLFFEIISKATKVVVQYPWEGLCLLTMIDNDTGEEPSYEELRIFWQKFNSYAKDHPWCRLVERFDKSVEECMADTDMTEEGYVVAVRRRGLPPIRSKIKLAEYCRLHRIVTGVTPQKIWYELAYPTEPWIGHNSELDRTTKEVAHDMPVPTDFVVWVQKWHNVMVDMFHARLLESLHVLDVFHQTTGGYQKEHECWNYLRTIFPPERVKVASMLYRGKIAEAYEELWKQVRPHGREEAETYYVDGKGE
jgi:hypothetical protein